MTVEEFDKMKWRKGMLCTYLNNGDVLQGKVKEVHPGLRYIVVADDAGDENIVDEYDIISVE